MVQGHTHTHTYIYTDVIEKDEQGSTYFRLPNAGTDRLVCPALVSSTPGFHIDFTSTYLNIPHGSKCSDTLRPDVSGPFVLCKKWLLLEVLKESKYAREYPKKQTPSNSSLHIVTSLYRMGVPNLPSLQYSGRM